MGLSIAIILVTLFVVFMYTAKGVSDKAKTATMAIAIIFILYLIYRVIGG